MSSLFTVRSPALFRSTLAALVGAIAVLAASPNARSDEADSVAAVITRLRVQEAPQPVRERSQWRAPGKVVLLEFANDSAWVGREAAFAAAAPKAQIIAAKDRAAAVTATADADVIVGFNPDICSAKLIDNDKQLRWIASLAAGVEHCMAVPGIRACNLLATNMRGVDAPVIAEHAIALPDEMSAARSFANSSIQLLKTGAGSLPALNCSRTSVSSLSISASAAETAGAARDSALCCFSKYSIARSVGLR
jgi:hypothetical protein